MLAFLIRWSAEYRLLVIGICTALAAVGFWTLPRQQLDALPDVSDPQVILYARWDQPPDLLEAQVTYPLTTALLGAPRVRAVRGYTDAGYSLIYILFEDGVDLYWARSRVMELLSKTTPLLPTDARVEMGPDATAVGWIFQYALVDDTGTSSLAELRALQDWNLRYVLQATPGVAEVAGIGGFEKEYQVTVDPQLLEEYNLSLQAVLEAVRNSNMDTGGRIIDFSDRNYTVRGRGLAHTLEDLRRAVIYGAHARRDMNLSSPPVLLQDIARIEMVPRSRQGVSDLDGNGEAVGGVVIMRDGQNALQVIRQVKDRLQNLQRSLPPGVRIVTTYDRSELIGRSLRTLRQELFFAVLVVSLVILVFLRHFPSSLVAMAIIPATLLIALLPMYWFRVNLNIMSLAGIILSAGVLVDGAIIEVENAHRRLSLAIAGGGKPDTARVLLQAMQEVTPAVFLSLLSIGVTFLPVFALTGQEGRLFRPLAAAKTIVMTVAAVLTLTLAPALRLLFRRVDGFRFQPRRLAHIANHLLVGRYREEAATGPLHSLAAAYESLLRIVLRFPRVTVALAVLLAAATVPVYWHLSHEFLPPLNEETILYMPTTLPGISAAHALQLLQRQDAVLKSFPEVARVYGKAGRAATPTDPAPLNMIETTVVLKPREQWRERPRWYSAWSPEWLKDLIFRKLAGDRISYDDLIAEMNRATALPGVVNSWTMPIRGRTDMLTTGARTPVAVKVLGPDLSVTQELAERVEAVLKRLHGTRSAFAERAGDGYFVDVEINRDHLADYGFQVGDVQGVIACAIGGAPASEIFDGRERYPVTVRYASQFRDSLEQIGRITVPNGNGERIPLDSLASIHRARGASMIRTEGGMLASYVFVDTDSDDIGRYVETAQRAILRDVSLPPGYSLAWSGEYENMLRARERLQIVVPVTLLLLVFLLYMNTRSAVKTGIVLLAVPFSLIGAVLLLYALGYSVSVATWVGMIALMGLDAETGVFMLLFLDLAYEELYRDGRPTTRQTLADAVVEGAARRLRPKLMTVMAAFLGLLPAMLAIGTGADMAKRIVAPMAGGLIASFALELLIYPPLYYLWKLRTQSAALPPVSQASINNPEQ